MCVTFFCIYVSTLQLPISAFSKAFDCKGEEGSKGTQGKRGKARESDAAELRRTQHKGDRREKLSEE